MTTQVIETYAPELPQAARLHLARYLAGLDMQELAEATGISRSTIRNYESLTWNRPRNPAYLRLWAMATGVPLSWLQTGTVPGPGDGQTHLDRLNGHADGFAEILPFRLRPTG